MHTHFHYRHQTLEREQRLLGITFQGIDANGGTIYSDGGGEPVPGRGGDRLPLSRAEGAEKAEADVTNRVQQRVQRVSAWQRLGGETPFSQNFAARSRMQAQRGYPMPYQMASGGQGSQWGQLIGEIPFVIQGAPMAMPGQYMRPQSRPSSGPMWIGAGSDGVVRSWQDGRSEPIRDPRRRDGGPIQLPVEGRLAPMARAQEVVTIPDSDEQIRIPQEPLRILRYQNGGINGPAQPEYLSVTRVGTGRDGMNEGGVHAMYVFNNGQRSLQLQFTDPRPFTYSVELPQIYGQPHRQPLTVNVSGRGRPSMPGSSLLSSPSRTETSPSAASGSPRERSNTPFYQGIDGDLVRHNDSLRGQRAYVRFEPIADSLNRETSLRIGLAPGVTAARGSGALYQPAGRSAVFFDGPGARAFLRDQGIIFDPVHFDDGSVRGVSIGFTRPGVFYINNRRVEVTVADIAGAPVTTARLATTTPGETTANAAGQRNRILQSLEKDLKAETAGFQKSDKQRETVVNSLQRLVKTSQMQEIQRQKLVSELEGAAGDPETVRKLTESAKEFRQTMEKTNDEIRQLNADLKRSTQDVEERTQRLDKLRKLIANLGTSIT